MNVRGISCNTKGRRHGNQYVKRDGPCEKGSGNGSNYKSSRISDSTTQVFEKHPQIMSLSDLREFNIDGSCNSYGESFVNSVIQKKNV